VTDTYVFDASALIALFDGDETAYRLIERADAGKLQVVFPAAAIAEANTYIQASESAWEAILLGRVDCIPLTEHIGVTIGPWPRDVAVRHVVYEAQAVMGDVVTREPYRYGPWTLPLVLL
jgi:hypothetical protein